MKITRKGFTLIELVIMMLIVVIVFGILANLVGFSTKFFTDENTAVANQSGLRQVAVTFEKDVRRYALKSSMISQSGACTLLDTAVTYCYVVADQTITRNGVVVAERIEAFNIVTSASMVRLTMDTIDDSRGQDVDISYDVYFRTDK